MRDRVRVSLAQCDCDLLDRESNAARMARTVATEAAGHGADVIVFPELASTGYIPSVPEPGYRQALYEQAEPVPGPTTDLLGEAAARHRVHVVAGVCELDGRDRLYNTAVLVGPDGGVVGAFRKLHLALNEKEYFEAGDEIGVFNTDLGCVGLSICYDVRFPELGRVQALRGAEILISIWAMWEQPGKAAPDSIAVRCRSRATENYVYVLGCNRSGRDVDRTFVGRSVIAGPSGEALALAPDGAETILRAELTGSILADQRNYLPVFEDRRPDLYGPLTE